MVPPKISFEKWVNRAWYWVIRMLFWVFLVLESINHDLRVKHSRPSPKSPFFGGWTCHGGKVKKTRRKWKRINLGRLELQIRGRGFQAVVFKASYRAVKECFTHELMAFNFRVLPDDCIFSYRRFELASWWNIGKAMHG